MLDILLQNAAGDIINTVVNRDPSWDKKIINFIIQIGFLVGIVYAFIAYFRYKNKPENKGKSFKDILTEDPRGLLNIVLLVSSALEILALVTMALDRNVPLVAAFTRYAILGFFEALSAYIAMDQISAVFADGFFNVSIKKVFTKDGIKKEGKKVANDFWNVVGAIVAFLISLACTTAIFFLYMESENATHLVSSGSGVPDVQFRSNQILEWGTIITIFCTPIITLVNGYFEITNAPKKRKWTPQKPNPFSDPTYKPDPDELDREKELQELIASASGVTKGIWEKELALLQGK